MSHESHRKEDGYMGGYRLRQRKCLRPG